MAINIQKLAEVCTIYGQPLYSATPDQLFGTADKAGEYEVRNGAIVVLDENDGEMFIPIRRSLLEDPAFDASKHIFSIGGFNALRDGKGEFEGKPWTITKGTQKVFAY